MNRLLVNMRNKIDIINGAIEMIHKLKKGGVIELNGLHKINVTSGKITDQEFNIRLQELDEEREKLQIRVSYLE